jgi:hypothetical protein
MNLKELNRSVSASIAEDKIVKAINTLQEQLIDTARELQDRCIHLKGRLKSLQKQVDGGFTDHASEAREMAKITRALQNLLEEIEPADLKVNASDQGTLLMSQLQKMGLKSLPKAALVDCDRTVPMQDFRVAFRQNRQLPSQFYFITGCPTQKPESLAERIIYDLIDDFLEGETDSIHYEPESFVLDERSGWEISRVKIAELPFSIYSTPAENELRFRKYFGALLKVFPSPEMKLEEMVANAATRLSYRLFTMIFKIDVEENSWTPELMIYLQWLIQAFKGNPGTPPTFKFLFVVSTPGMHRNPDPEVMAGLNELIRNHNTVGYQPCIHIQHLHPATEADLRRWFTRRTKNFYLEEIDEIINDYAASHRRLDMAVVEKFLLDIYKNTHQSQ